MANNSANYNVNMRFTADTGQAKQQLRDLQSSLDTLMNQIATKNIKFFDVNATKKEIDEASAAVQELKIALDQATNVNTGRLDLSKFSKSLSQSGYTLQDFATHLENLGPTGDKAFVALAQSVINAEVPLKRTNAILDNFKKTLANTAKWQISSNLMHGVQGSLQKAYYYAEDLNRSLNDIRIVTGQSNDQMAQFAEKANKAAQALSTTTTNYTNASLIYYQQGLSDKEVADRTEVTIKMANAAGESASKVSDQLTAVWNNFYDGSKSLEYYADVMTKLGAYTASSTDEISEGIQKFASVANTIGLSYEYATSALATLTAKTRESANTVGNSLKTLFARIQGLTLGETLEDGTDLNKYSKALEKVGINIKDQQGELKDMNTILDEMMNKWDSLSRAEQVALAQTVGGVRQYTQLVNLMENKDYFKELVGVAKNSKGTLQEQADIFAESWEASKKRVQASLEEIYKQLVNDKFFIGLNDTLSDTLNITSKLIDSLGGLPGVLSVVSTLMLKSFGPDIVNNMQRMASNLFIDSGAAQNQAAVMKKQMLEALNAFNPKADPQDMGAVEFQTKSLIDATQQSYDLQMASSKLNEIDLQRLKTLKSISDQYAQIAIRAKEAADAQTAQVIEARQTGLASIRQLSKKKGGGDKGVINAQKVLDSGQDVISNFNGLMNLDITKGTKIKDLVQQVQNLKLVGNEYKKLNNLANQYSQTQNKSTATAFRNELKNLQKQYQSGGKAIEQLTKQTDAYIDSQVKAKNISQSAGDIIKTIMNVLNGQAIKQGEAARATREHSKAIEEFNNTLARSQGAVATFSQGLVTSAQGATSILIAINSIKSALETLNNEDLSFGDKFLSMMTSISIAIPALISGFNSLATGIPQMANNFKLLGNNLVQLALGVNELKGANIDEAIRGLENTVGNSGIKAKILDRMRQAINDTTTETTQLAGAELAAAQSSAAMSAGFKALLGSIAPVAIGLAAVGVAIAGLIAYHNWKETFSVEAQIERSKQSLSEFESILSETKTKAEQLKSVFNNYQEVTGALDKCTVGTKEWRDQLAKANEEALNILDTYPELKNIKGAWSKNSSGQIIINEDALNQVQDIYDQRVAAVDYAIDYQKAKLQQLNVQQLGENFAESNLLGVMQDHGTAFPSLTIDTLGRLIAENIDLFKDADVQEFANGLETVFDKAGILFNNPEDLNGQKQEFEMLAYQILNDSEITDGLDQLVSALLDNTDATIQASKESKIQQGLGKETMESGEVTFTSNFMDAAIDEKVSEILKNNKFNWTYTDPTTGKKYTEAISSSGINKNDNNVVLNDIWKRYSQIAGFDYELDKDSVQGTGANRAFRYRDADNEVQTVSFETVAKALATVEVYANALEDSYEKATNFQGYLDGTGDNTYLKDEQFKSASSDTGKSILEFLGNKGDLSGLNKTQLENYNRAIQNLDENTFNNLMSNALGYGNYTELDDAQLKQFTSQLTNLYSEVGVTSFDAFKRAFGNEVKSDNGQSEKILADNFFAYLLEAANTQIAGFDQFAVNIQSKLSNLVKDVFKTAGYDGVNALVEAINASGSDITLDQLDQIENIFKTSSSVDEFIKQLEKLGLVTNESKDAWVEYYNKLVEAGNNLPIAQFENFRQILSDIFSLLNGKIGSVISQEDIDKLEKFGIDWKKYFVQTGPDEYTQTQEYTTEDKNKILGSTISQMEENGQYAEQNEDRILNKTTIDDKTLSEWVSTLTAAGAEQASGDVISRIAMAFGGIDNLAKFTGIDADQFDSKVFEQMDATNQGNLIQAIINAFASNKEYINDIQSAKVESYSNADSVLEASQLNGFREDGKITEAGAQGLLGWAGKNKEIDGVSEALDNYNKVASKTNVTEEELNKATEELYKELRNAEINKARKELSNYNETLKDAKEGTLEYNEAQRDIANTLSKLLNVKVSPEFIVEGKNKELFEKLLYGTKEEQEQALNGLEFNAIIKAGVDFNQGEAEAEQEFSNFITTLETMSEDVNIDGTVNLDTTDAQTALGGVYTALTNALGEASPLAGLLNSIFRTNMNLNGEQLKVLINFLKKVQEAIKGDEDALDYLVSSGLNDLTAAGIEWEGQATNEIQGDMIDSPGDGGGGGSSSTKSASDIGKEIQDKQIEVKEKKRDRLEALREGANPEDSAKYIQEEIKLLEEEQDILEDQIKSWKKLLKLKVEEFNKEHPEFEIKLTDDGEIANASELWGKVWAQYQKNLEDGMSEEDLNEWFTKIKDSLDGPMGIQQNIDENVALIAQKEKEAAELELEAITKQIDWKVKQIDFQIKRLNYYQEKLLKQAHGNKQTIEAMLEGFAYQEQEMLQLFDKGATLRQGIDQLNAAKAKYPGYEQMFDEQILEYQSDLIDVNEAILDLRNDIEDLVQNVLDLALDEIDKQIERLDTYTSMLDHLNNIIDLSGRSMLDMGLKTQIGATKVETMLGKMKSLKTQMDGLTKATKEAQAALADRQVDGDTSSVKFWENQVEVLKQETEKASDEFLASWEETLEAAQDLFEMRVEMAVNVLSNALSPFETLEDFQDKYEKAKTINEEYLDDAERLYELNKLNRQLNLQLADTNDLLAKQKLRDIQQEIHDLQADGVQMSQYDLEYLQKKYDLQLAEIALMEQQNSKTSMRLVRDAAGNWTYAYDADEEKIEDATQKYEDAVHELGQLSKDYINDVSEQLIQNQIDFKEALQDLDKNSADYSNQLLSLQEYYVERQRYLLDELNKGVVNSGLTFHDTLYGQMTDLYDYNDAYMQFVNNSNTTITELQTNYKDWQKVVETAMGVAGTSWDNFGTDMGGTLDSLEEHIQKLCDEIEKLVNVLMGYISQSIGMVLDWEQKYSKRTDEELAKNEAYIDGNFVGGGGGGSYGNVDMRTDFTALLQRWEAGDRNLTNWDGSKTYTSAAEIAADLQAKLDAVKQGEKIQYQGSGENFSSEDQQDVVDKFLKGYYSNGGNYGSNSYPNTYSNNIVDKAANYLGTKYTYGGKNASTGLDCSGLVYKALNDAGVNVPVLTAEGYKQMSKSISSTNIKPGDLVFFGANGVADHVGIYMGNGQMINAIGTKTQITSIDSKKAGLIGYGRIGNSNTLPSANSVIQKFLSGGYGGAASGAYTGDWGPGQGIGIDNGKIIKVHPKELILNKSDTRNILRTVDIVRNMNDWVDKQVQQMSNISSSKLDSLFNSAIPRCETQPIKQEVIIQADFPGVTDHYEIEEALSNLSNNAAQYISANRSK